MRRTNLMEVFIGNRIEKNIINKPRLETALAYFEQCGKMVM